MGSTSTSDGSKKGDGKCGDDKKKEGVGDDDDDDSRRSSTTSAICTIFGAATCS
jgi:hypothetical protein